MLALVLVAVGAFGAAYSYFIYPLLLFLARDAARGERDEAGRMPELTLIIAARNERLRIKDKIEESLALRHLCAGLEIIVASDASTDGTDDIVRSFQDEGVKLVRTEAHNGKEYAQQSAIRASGGEIIMFSDTGTTIRAGSVERIVELFADSGVGAVSSTDLFVDNDGVVSGEGLYIRYEMWLRSLESRKGGLIGLSGSFFAARRAVCESWDTDIPSDFAIAMNARMLGLRAISDPDVVGLYRDTRDPRHEHTRKIRTVIRGMAAMARKKEFLNPLRHGRFSFQLWSHKILRWAVPWFVLIYACGASLALASSPAYWLLLAPVLALAALSALGTVLPSSRRRSMVNAACYFIEANVAVLMAGIQFLAGKRVTTWVPTRR